VIVTVRRRGARVDATIDRPEALNALNHQVIAELDQLVREWEADDSVRVGVITGTGSKAFCAGADLRELQGLDHAEADDWLAQGHRLMDRVAASRTPIVAAVNGLALGGGFELVLASTIAVACARARFGLPEARLGLIPGLGGTSRLRDAVGRHRAMRLMLSGEMVGAHEAFALGLLSQEPVPDELLPSVVDELVDALLLAGPRATRTIRELTDGAAAPSASLYAERGAAAAAVASAEGAEGITAHQERRKPVWAASPPAD